MAPFPSGTYVVIRGPLGVGKTTVATALAAAVGGQVVSIDRILEEHRLEEWEAGYVSERSFRRANAVAVREAGAPGRGRGPVIFDGNFYHRSQLRDLARRLGAPPYVFSLWAPVSVCRSRDRHRPGSYGTDAVRQVYRKAVRVREGQRVDARAPVPEVVARIIATLRAKPERKGRSGKSVRTGSATRNL